LWFALATPPFLTNACSSEQEWAPCGSRSRALDNAYEPIRVAIGQGLQQHRTDDAEDGGGHTDAESQRDHCSKREASVPRKRPHAVPEITPGSLADRSPTDITNGIPDGKRAAHFKASASRRLFA
jgi:hypothetical protein